MNWLLIGIGLLIVGLIVIGYSARQARYQQGDPSGLSQTGYLLTVFGIFAIIAQYLSIGDTLLIVVLGTGLTILCDRFILRKRRRENQPEPGWVEFSRGFFPVLLIVFIIRGFIVEPYQIPSSSMRPGLIPGDFILVNKFTYGLRLPLTNKIIIPIRSPKQGDVMVFNYPNDPKVNYIKRVIGLPGDTIRYFDKKLTINGQPVPTTALNTLYPYQSEENYSTVPHLYSEILGGKTYQTLHEKDYPPLFLGNVQEFVDRENCQYDEQGFTCVVPAEHYFTMGDNRDHSGDSRYWGFVPEKYVVGKAFFVWLNISHLSRIFTPIK